MTREELKAWLDEKRRMSRELPVRRCYSCGAFFKRFDGGVCPSCQSPHFGFAGRAQVALIEHLLEEI